MCIEPHFLFEIDAEEGREQRVLVVQQSARVGVFARVGEQPIEAWLVATPECAAEVRPRSSMARSASRYVEFVRPIAIALLRRQWSTRRAGGSR